MQKQPKRRGGLNAPLFLLGVVLGGIAYLAGAKLYPLFATQWPEWLRMLYFGGVIICGGVALFLILAAVGLYGSDLFARSAKPHEVSVALWFCVYFGSLTVAIVVCVILMAGFHLDPLRAALSVGGVMFLVASTGRPWWLFETFRRAGWFALIGSDATMRSIVAIVGILYLLCGILARQNVGAASTMQ